MKKIINYEDFEKNINIIKSYIDFENRLYDSTNGAFDLLEIEEIQNLLYALKDSLEREFEDKSEWIDYFCFETNFGEKDLKCSIIENGIETKVKLNTIKDLYDILIKNLKK